ncbi:RING finger protein 207-like [Elysia marginata]|uniref:RING finger protein 207-like n=1 Tax=Elysia marginata TaxID=1093978 RepID=A0AAV4EUQ3_9GAST|nr:RING finger protein 207-like [Elysia marginata]
MSGDIFQPMEIQDDPTQPTPRNPLLCYLCNEPYEEPCLLGCFHSFCVRCLRGRSSDGKIMCPLCGYNHTLKDGSSLPPVDLLLKFMVEASTEEKAQCANCDCSRQRRIFNKTQRRSSEQDSLALSDNSEIHEEPYIMFSSEKKIMLCINCFRDMRIPSPSDLRVLTFPVSLWFPLNCHSRDSILVFAQYMAYPPPYFVYNNIFYALLLPMVKKVLF